MATNEFTNAPSSLLYEKVKSDLIMAFRTIIGEYKLPLFLIDGILTSILMDIRSESTSAMVSETSDYIDTLVKNTDKKESEDNEK